MKQQTHPLNPNSTLNHESIKSIIKEDTYKSDGVTIHTTTIDGNMTGGTMKKLITEKSGKRGKSLVAHCSPSTANLRPTQTVEERLKESMETVVRTTMNYIQGIITKEERNIIYERHLDFIKQELKANDDAWREKIAGFPKKMEFNPETDNLEIDIIKAYKFFTNLKKNK